MRGFKPSYFQIPTELPNDRQRTKEENLRKYIQRVQAGLPLFEEDSPPLRTSEDVSEHHLLF